jgi:hypothetical protein
MWGTMGGTGPPAQFGGQVVDAYYVDAGRKNPCREYRTLPAVWDTCRWLLEALAVQAKPTWGGIMDHTFRTQLTKCPGKNPWTYDVMEAWAESSGPKAAWSR